MTSSKIPTSFCNLSWLRKVAGAAVVQALVVAEEVPALAQAATVARAGAELRVALAAASGKQANPRLRAVDLEVVE